MRRDPVAVSSRSVQGRVRLAYAPVAAAAWVLVALLDVAVRVVCFPKQRTEGAASALWGLGFGLFLWAGLVSVGLEQARAIPFGAVAGAVIAVFVYMRGNGLEAPPAERPWAFLRRRRGRPPRPQPRRSPPGARDLLRARIALDDREFDSALHWLREAERVAVAQRKLDELLEVRGLLATLSARSFGRTKARSDRLARLVAERLEGFPPAARAAAGLPVDDRDLAKLVRDVRAARPPGARPHATAYQLAQARAALDGGSPATALALLEEARRVAVAQASEEELVDVLELVEALAARSAGRTRTGSERLAGAVERELRAYARTRGV